MKQPNRKERNPCTSTNTLMSLGFLPSWMLLFLSNGFCGVWPVALTTMPHMWTRETLIVVNSPELLFCNPELNCEVLGSVRSDRPCLDLKSEDLVGCMRNIPHGLMYLHLVTRRWRYLGSVWNLSDVGTCQRNYITDGSFDGFLPGLNSVLYLSLLPVWG